MNINEVIELGEVASKLGMDSFMKYTMIALILAVIVVTFLSIMYVKWDGGDFADYVTIIIRFNLLTICVIGILSVILNSVFYADKREAAIHEWESKYAQPYIDNLDPIKKEVVYIKIDPEIETTGDWRYLHSTTKTSVTITYKDENNNLITETGEASTNMALKDTESPYIEYQYLNKRLSKDYPKGKYNVKLHLPSDYKFDTIK